MNNNQLLSYRKDQVKDHSYVVRDKRSSSNLCIIIAYDELQSKTRKATVSNYVQKIK